MQEWQSTWRSLWGPLAVWSCTMTSFSFRKISDGLSWEVFLQQAQAQEKISEIRECKQPSPTGWFIPLWTSFSLPWSQWDSIRMEGTDCKHLMPHGAEKHFGQLSLRPFANWNSLSYRKEIYPHKQVCVSLKASEWRPCPWRLSSIEEMLWVLKHLRRQRATQTSALPLLCCVWCPLWRSWVLNLQWSLPAQNKRNAIEKAQYSQNISKISYFRNKMISTVLIFSTEQIPLSTPQTLNKLWGQNKLWFLISRSS